MQNPSAIRTRPRAAAPARQLSWSFILLVITCACVVAAGFFFAASQHFTSMDYGLKNSKLREQLHNLEAEKRRLMLAREMALSPLAIRKAARGLNLRENSGVATIATSSRTAEKTAATAIKAKAVDAPGARDNAATVIRTSLSAPVRPRIAALRQTGETRSRVVDVPSKRPEVVALLKFR